ncbi:MAG: glycosyltransferase [Clostridia bacterium]|nr:glycosyltransferase [Clostridia bacterium]
MKKICFITTIPGTLSSFVVDTAKYLYKKGNFDITFISNPDSNFQESLPEYIHFIPVKMKRGIGFDGLRVILKLYKIFKSEKFDIIQYSTPNASLYASIAAKLSKIKVRLYCQWGIRYVGFQGIKRKTFKFIEKVICNNSTWIEPDSFGNLEFSHNEKLYDKNKSSVIWNGSASGVDLEKFNINNKEKWNDEIRKEYNLNNKIVLGFIGRLEKDKGINELFEAVKTIKNDSIKLVVVGAIDKPKTINQELFEWAQKSENVIFTGRVCNVEKYYSAFDIFILPSYREGFGSVVVEAEAMGVPVIVTDIPGPTDAMLKNKTGLVVRKADVESLQYAINQLLENKKMRQEMGKQSIIFAREKFDSNKLFEYILKDRNRLIENLKK